MATDVKLPDFDPQTSSFNYLSGLLRKAHTLGGHSGITIEQLKAICIQCSHCKRLLSRITHQYHECPVEESLEESDDGDFFKSPEYRLDAVGEGAALIVWMPLEREPPFMVWTRKPSKTCSSSVLIVIVWLWWLVEFIMSACFFSSTSRVRIT